MANPIHRIKLHEYVGYEVSTDFVLTIIKNDNQLILQIPEQGEVPIFPKSQSEFFIMRSEAELTFNINEAGKVESLTVHPDGGDDTIHRKLCMMQQN
jgi:hypothetical protein